MPPDRSAVLAADAATPLATDLKAASMTAPKALVFDTFGTVVDWRSSVSAEVSAFARKHGLTLDPDKFADAWRAGYGPAMNRVRSGDLPWTPLDPLHRMILDKVLVDFGVRGIPEPELANLNHVWRRLRPWPDAVAGLTRLKAKYTIAPLSNGSIALMTSLARFGGLPWDCILGAELVRHYKTDPEVYRSAPAYLDLAPGEVMMVAPTWATCAPPRPRASPPPSLRARRNMVPRAAPASPPTPASTSPRPTSKTWRRSSAPERQPAAASRRRRRRVPPSPRKPISIAVHVAGSGTEVS